MLHYYLLTVDKIMAAAQLVTQEKLDPVCVYFWALSERRYRSLAHNDSWYVNKSISNHNGPTIYLVMKNRTLFHNVMVYEFTVSGVL